MFARNVSGLVWAAIFFLTTSSAFAKQWSFDSGIPFGLGLHAGLSQNPDTDLIGTPQTTSTGFSHFFGFEPFFDFGNFELRLSGQYHNFPVVSTSGRENGVGDYGETSDVGMFLYGAQLRLIPFLSDAKTARGYIKLGLARALASGDNARNYANAKYTEAFEAASRELSLGAGFEFFVVQNYSLQIEGGFRQLEFKKFVYSEAGTDLLGTSKNKGDPLLTSNGTERKLNHSGLYTSLGLNLHF